MEGMSGYYSPVESSHGPQGSMNQYAQERNLSSGPTETLGVGEMGGAQTLDQIINHNNQELMRRRTYQPQYRQSSYPDTHHRRASMLEFGSTLNNDLAEFQFDPSPAHSVLSTQIASSVPAEKSLGPPKGRSREDLSLDTRFSRMSTHYGPMSSISSFHPALMSNTPMSAEHSSAYLPQPMDMSMDYENRNGDVALMNSQNAPFPRPVYTESPIAQNYPSSHPPSYHDPGGSTPHTPLQPNVSPHPTLPHSMKMQLNKQPHLRPPRGAPSPHSASVAPDAASMPSPAQMQQMKQRRMSTSDITPQYRNPAELSSDQIDSTVSGQHHSKWHNAYSTSGFDMLGVLMRIATRKKPEINIGPVDLSCAFVVCDIQQHDLPIVYISDAFERLTGYTRYEILGQNCRFLQAPDGRVQSGIKRKYVDDRSVLYLKNQISKRAEAQLSLINYRKGGQPFMNLLTMIPIQWDDDEFRYYVGFQVDLVEQPNSVAGKNPDGTYAINYQRGQLPSYVIQNPDKNSVIQSDLGQTIPRDEVSMCLASLGTGETENMKRILDKVLLENTDDVVHVLSLKGLFLYLSPACRKVLEYDATELVGTALSSVCHPSDIVPVTRELKETTSGATVSVVYRIRRKQSGYTWFEAHGSLHTEQGKGRKCIILVGRERPVYALNRSDITGDSGITDNELWSKMSTSGMFLYVSSNVRPMLDQVAEELVGTSMQTLMRVESRKELGKALELARLGEKSTFKHDLQNRRGQVLHAQTTVYPGDAQKGSKPTFVLAQTRLLKMTRAMLLNQKPAGSPRTDQASVGSATPPTNMSAPSSNPSLSRNNSAVLSPPSTHREEGILTASGGNALPLGNQDEALASEDNIFDELKTTRSSSWQFELRQMERQNRLLYEDLQALLSQKKKRKRRKGLGQPDKECVNCHTRVTPEWRRGPSGQRDLCNSCGLRWAKQNGRVSPRKSSTSDRDSNSPARQVHGPEGQATPANGFTAHKEKMTRNMPPSIDEGQEPSHKSVLPT